MKQCTKCNEVKPFSEFYRASKNKPGYVPWCKVCMHAYQRATYKGKDPVKQKSGHLLRAFNLTADEYNAMVASQNGLCASCGNPESKLDHRTGEPKGLAVDHCHTTGDVRALLCNSCNIALGLLQDDPGRIERLLRYIQSFQ